MGVVEVVFDGAATILGVVGASIILIAFTLNQIGKLTTESKLYDGLNFLGSLILFLYAYLLWSYPFMILNAIWMIVSIQSFFKSKRQ